MITLSTGAKVPEPKDLNQEQLLWCSLHAESNETPPDVVEYLKEAREVYLGNKK